MADYRAIATVCEAVMRGLRLGYRAGMFNSQRLEFKVSLTSDLISRGRYPRPGVTLYLYHISHNAQGRALPPRGADNGGLEPPELLLDLHFLLSAWAKEANTQQALSGWVMRRMEDQPVLTAASLNAITPACFQPDETVEIVLDVLSSLDVIRIWEKAVRNPYHLSVPYIARNIAIKTLQPEQNP
jgi:hypothetical protein